MLSTNTIQSNNFRVKILELKSVFKRNNLQINNGRQTSGLSSVVLFVALRCSSRLKKPPFHKPLATKKKSSFEKKQLFFCCRRSQSSHVLYPSFVVATLSATQTRLVRKKTRRVSVCVHRHLFFQRLLFRPAINLNRNANADLNYLFR